nr:hypothetical protein CFP56_11428 [Quercus suber]
MASHALEPEPALARREPASRDLGHRLRAPAALQHARRRPARAHLDALQALRRGRLRLRRQSLRDPPRLARHPELVQRARDARLPRLPVRRLHVRRRRPRAPGPRRPPAGRPAAGPAARARPEPHRVRPRRRRRRPARLLGHQPDVLQDDHVHAHRGVFGLRQHRPQLLVPADFSVLDPQRRVDRRAGLPHVRLRQRDPARARVRRGGRQEGSLKKELPFVFLPLLLPHIPGKKSGGQKVWEEETSGEKENSSVISCGRGVRALDRVSPLDCRCAFIRLLPGGRERGRGRGLLGKRGVNPCPKSIPTRPSSAKVPVSTFDVLHHSPSKPAACFFLVSASRGNVPWRSSSLPPSPSFLIRKQDEGGEEGLCWGGTGGQCMAAEVPSIVILAMQTDLCTYRHRIPRSCSSRSWSEAALSLVFWRRSANVMVGRPFFAAGSAYRSSPLVLVFRDQGGLCERHARAGARGRCLAGWCCVYVCAGPALLAVGDHDDRASGLARQTVAVGESGREVCRGGNVSRLRPAENLAPDRRHFSHIAERETDSDRSMVHALVGREALRRRGIQQLPVGDRGQAQIAVFGDVRDAVQRVRSCAEADGGDDGVVCAAVFVRHDPVAGKVLVDQAVVDAVWAVGEDAKVVETGDDGFGKPEGNRGGEEGVGCGEACRDSLKAPVRKRNPAVWRDLI